MLSVNTNIAALQAQQNLTNSQTTLNTSLERLSSGLRINSAADDPAGLQIADGFTSQINGLNQASQNANDAISLAQTAEGALSQITNNLQTIRQLAVESANGTNSASDRQALDQEVQQDIAEVNRIATQTSFNGQNILDGTFGNAQFQVGANVGQTINVDGATSVQTNAIGSYAYQAGTATQTPTQTVTGDSVAPVTAITYQGVSGTAFDGSNTYTITAAGGTPVTLASSAQYAGSADEGQTAGSAYALAAAINASQISGVSASASTSVTLAGASGSNWVSISGGAAGSTGSEDYQLSINGTVVFDTGSVSTATATTNFTVQQVASAINQQSDSTGVTATVTSAGKLQLDSATGGNIALSENVTGTADTTAAATAVVTSGLSTTTAAAAGDDAAGTSTLTVAGQVTISSNSNLTLSAGAATALGQANPTISTGSSLSQQNVLTVAGANQTILSVDSAIQAVDALSATFGAVQNRFQSAIATLGTTSTNLTSARSNVQDADFASETSNLTRAQILQQAGVSILAQANALPQGVLKLLQ
jgi:flagellin